MPFVRVQDIDLWYERSGGSGPTLILTHGFAGPTADWGPIIEAFRAHFDLVLYDVRGHHRSVLPEGAPCSVPQFAADLELTNTRAHWAAPFPKTNVALRNQMQDVLNCMKKDGTIARLSEKWFGRVPGPDSLERVITPGYGVPCMPGYYPTPHELKCG